jgi:NitT/TauT family transport system substrate-binding protein
VQIDRHLAQFLGPLTVAALLIAPLVARAGDTSVVTQLGWLRIGEYAPILIADAKGFFKDEGIDHKIVDGGPGKNPIPIVAVGQAQFGVTSNGMFLVSARSAKDPVDVVAVGSLFQESPTAYLSLAAPDAPPSKPKDMEGKTVGVQPGAEFTFHAFTKKNGVDESKVKLVTVQGTAEPLMVGRVDFFLGWVVNQTYQVEQVAAKPDAPPTVKGKVWRALRFAEFGLPTYSDVIFASGDTLKKNPELVKSYLKAVQRGMDFVISHPDEAAETLAAFPGQIEDVKKLAWRFKLQNQLFQSADTKTHGYLWMNPATWEQMIAVLVDGEQIPKPIPVAEVMTDDYLPKPGPN